jgi:molybdopterin/thiamine biosynthesis adenylyltransferase
VPAVFWDVDLVCCCVDSDHARWVVNLRLLALDRGLPCVSGAAGRGMVSVTSVVPGRTACLVCGWTRDHYDATLQESVAAACDPYFQSTVAGFPQISPLTSLVGGTMAYRVAEVLGGSTVRAASARMYRIDLATGRMFCGDVCRNSECAEALCRDAGADASRGGDHGG